MKTIQAILFDMDGTLVDSERVGQKAWAATADEMGIEIPDDLVRAFIGRRPSHAARCWPSIWVATPIWRIACSICTLSCS